MDSEAQQVQPKGLSPSDRFFRIEDRRYSVADEYGEHSYTRHEIAVLVFPVVNYTTCGAWIGLNYSHYPRSPNAWTERCIVGKRFVNLQATKRYALPTLEEAIESYRARKGRQKAIYQARIRSVDKYLEILSTFEANHDKLEKGLDIGFCFR